MTLGSIGATGYSDREVPLVPGTIRGYRVWRIERRISDLELWPKFWLGSTSHNYLWQPGVNIAECSYRDAQIYNHGQGSCDWSRMGLATEKHELSHWHLNRKPPVQRCSCGFYATLRTYPEEWFLQVGGVGHGLWKGVLPAYVRGVIRASGRIILGTKGFRAEKVEVEALCLPLNQRPPLLVETGPVGLGHYKVPILEIGPEEFIDRYPPSDLSALLREPEKS